MANDITWLFSGYTVGGTATTSASAAAAMPSNQDSLYTQLRIASAGSFRIAFGNSTVTASASSPLIIGNTVEYFDWPARATHYSVLALTGSQDYSISSGSLLSVR